MCQTMRCTSLLAVSSFRDFGPINTVDQLEYILVAYLTFPRMSERLECGDPMSDPNPQVMNVRIALMKDAGSMVGE